MKKISVILLAASGFVASSVMASQCPMNHKQQSNSANAAIVTANNNQPTKTEHNVKLDNANCCDDRDYSCNKKLSGSSGSNATSKQYDNSAQHFKQGAQQTWEGIKEGADAVGSSVAGAAKQGWQGVKQGWQQGDDGNQNTTQSTKKNNDATGS